LQSRHLRHGVAMPSVSWFPPAAKPTQTPNDAPGDLGCLAVSNAATLAFPESAIPGGDRKINDGPYDSVECERAARLGQRGRVGAAARREASTARPLLVAQADHLQSRGELHRRLLPRPVHHASVLEGALVERPNRRDRRTEVTLDWLEGRW
jgi:hypothetical protein